MPNGYDIRDAARQLRQRTASVEDKIDKADPPRTAAGEKRVAAPSRRRGATAEDAKRTEHKGTSGERAFGAPITSPADRLRKAQTTDSNN